MKNKINTIKITMLIFIVPFAVNAQTYKPTDVAVINKLITDNGLQATLDAPETWDFADWDLEEWGSQILRIYGLDLQEKNLTGKVTLYDLTKMWRLTIRRNLISELDVSNCTRLQMIECSTNRLKK